MRKTFTLEFNLDDSWTDQAAADSLEAALIALSRDIEGVAGLKLDDLAVQPFDGLLRDNVVEMLGAMGSQHMDPDTNEMVSSEKLFKERS